MLPTTRPIVRHRNIFVVQRFECSCICRATLANTVVAIHNVRPYLCWMLAANDWRPVLDYWLCLAVVGGRVKGKLVALMQMGQQNSMVHRRPIFARMPSRRIHSSFVVLVDSTESQNQKEKVRSANKISFKCKATGVARTILSRSDTQRTLIGEMAVGCT